MPETFTAAQSTALLLLGTFFGEAPDIDILYFMFVQAFSKNKDRKESHRDFITHVPSFWLIISLIIVGAGWLAGSEFAQMLGWVVLAGTWSHFILDSIEYGIRWLAPFSNKRFCLREIVWPKIEGLKGTPFFYWKELKDVYSKMITFYAEIAIVIIAIWVAFHR